MEHKVLDQPRRREKEHNQASVETGEALNRSHLQYARLKDLCLWEEGILFHQTTKSEFGIFTWGSNWCATNLYDDGTHMPS